MDVDFERTGGALLARLRGRYLDARSADKVTVAVGARLAAGEMRIGLDMSSVSFLDSSGLGTLVRLLGQAPAAGRLVLFGCREQVVALVRQSRLERVLLCYPDEAAALAALAAE
ncbi:MAG: STAS domain-containing protein [Vicinamibacteria bacterium]